MTRGRTWALIWLASAIAALLLLAAGLASVTFRPGRMYDLGSLALPGGAPASAPAADLPPPPWLGVVVSLVVLALLVYLAINLILSRTFRREVLIRVFSMLMFILFLYLFISALRGTPSQGGRLLAETSVPPPPPARGEPFPTFVANPAPWLVIAISAILAAALLGGMWFLWRRVRPRPRPLAQLAGQAQAALADLQAGGDLADTVLRCYAEMSRILSEQRGLDRAHNMTPREFERQLAAAGLRDEHIQQLTRLFERVRYGARRADVREERAAVACLTAIAQSYGGGHA